MSVTLVQGLMFGDEGKGALVDFLARRDPDTLVVRFNGGPQAGHNVVTADGRHHTFSSFGSGMLAGAGTYLARTVLVDPLAMMAEAMHLEALGVKDPWARLYVDRRCVVITPYHRALNRLRELTRGPARHGSCGVGFGEAVADAADPALTLTVADLEQDDAIHAKLLAIRARKLVQLRKATSIASFDDLASAGDVVHRALADISEPVETWMDRYAMLPLRTVVTGPRFLKACLAHQPVVFEGAQGVLLDQAHGFQPHTTWSDCTFGNAWKVLLEAGYSSQVTTVGVVRSYATRHGAGPFPTEDPAMTLADPHNVAGPWQGPLRLGAFDVVLAKRAIRLLGGVDVLAVNHLDQFDATPRRVCIDYGNRFDIMRPEPHYVDAPSATALLALLRDRLATPIGFVSCGPTAENRSAVESAAQSVRS
jgi:adenylosuccinate synthase